MSRRERARVVTDVEREIERRLVARLRAGDAAAFEAVYDAYRPRLFTFLARLSRRRDVAEDLLHETWLRLVTAAPRLSDDTCLAAWLFTVARNLHASWCRHRALDGTRIADAPASWPQPPRGESPFEATSRSETERRLERALARLPLSDRELLLLAAVEGVPPGEVAADLGLSPEAVRKRLQRARERLAAELEAEHEFTRAKAG
jgi:RNA polymerase sigma factor (sigma-70 family)